MVIDIDSSIIVDPIGSLLVELSKIKCVKLQIRYNYYKTKVLYNLLQHNLCNKNMKDKIFEYKDYMLSSVIKSL